MELQKILSPKLDSVHLNEKREGGYWNCVVGQNAKTVRTCWAAESTQHLIFCKPMYTCTNKDPVKDKITTYPTYLQFKAAAFVYRSFETNSSLSSSNVLEITNFLVTSWVPRTAHAILSVNFACPPAGRQASPSQWAGAQTQGPH